MITNKDFIKLISEDCGYSRKDIEQVLKSMRTIMINATKQHEIVKVFNGLIMEGKEVAARDGRNPQTGEPMKIPAYTKMTFRTGKSVKQELGA